MGFESVFWLLSVASQKSIFAQTSTAFTVLFLSFDVLCLLMMLLLFGQSCLPTVPH